MKQQNLIAAGLLLLASVLIISSSYAKGWGPLGVLNSGMTRLTSGSSRLVSSDSLRVRNYVFRCSRLRAWHMDQFGATYD